MNEKLIVEYEDGKTMEIEISPKYYKTGGGLGGLDELKKISGKVFEESISSMAWFLKRAAVSIKDEFNDMETGDITLSMGMSLNLEGNFIIGVGAETNFNIEVTIKR
ncbi:MAG: hypothetical protein LBV08_08230 [Clostridiales bacterium]|jgi:hypothetical protein|nr:hypothetical protein [Clostridiales bacterium]